MIDYKISRITRYDDITEVSFTVYRGDFVSRDFFDELTGITQTKTVYDRTAILGSGFVQYQGNIAPTREERNDYVRRFMNEKLSQIAKLPDIKDDIATFQSTLEPYGSITVLDYSFTKV